MKFCSGCLQKAKLVIEEPQMLVVHIGCDKCGNKTKKSFDTLEVEHQMILLENILRKSKKRKELK